MKYSLYIVFLFIGISNGFLGPIGQAINNIDNSVQSVTNQTGQAIDNAVNGIKGQVENVVDHLLSFVNGIQFAANFLWDSVFSPAFDMLTQGQSFLDYKFDVIANVVNHSIAVPENPLSDKYAQLVARFKSNIHHLYEQLFLMEQETFKAIHHGELNFEGRIRAFYDKIDAIKKQIDEWAVELKSELEVYALTLVGDLENVLNQYKQKIDLTVQSIERMFEQLTQNLIKNFIEFVQKIIPNAGNIIENMKEQGLLSFIPN